MNKAKVVVVQKVLEGLGQGFVDSADQQTALIFWRPSNTHTHTEKDSGHTPSDPLQPQSRATGGLLFLFCQQDDCLKKTCPLIQ